MRSTATLTRKRVVRLGGTKADAAAHRGETETMSALESAKAPALSGKRSAELMSQDPTSEIEIEIEGYSAVTKNTTGLDRGRSPLDDRSIPRLLREKK